MYYNPNKFEYYRADPKLFVRLQELAKENRQNPTLAEKRLWSAIRGKRLNGYKFRRQYIVERFIADFAFLQHKQIIEVDGSIHQDPEQKISDAERTLQLEAMGDPLYQ